MSTSSSPTGAAATGTGTLRTALRFLPVGAALFCIQLDFFSLTLALPTLANDLGTTVTDLQWLVSAYLITFGSILIPTGQIGERLGRRDVLLAGIALFGLSSLLCGLTSTVAVLIAGRVGQGIGAALIMPTGFALVANATTETERPKVLGALLAVAGAGTALGPVVGGVLAGTIGWRWVFLLNVPVAALALVLGRRLPAARPKDTVRTVRDLDWWGVLLVVGGLVLVSMAVDDVSSEGWGNPVTWGPLAGGIALLGGFVVRERRAAAPLVQPALVRNRLFVVLVAAGTLANVGTCVYIVVATIDLQDIRRLDPTTAGFAFTVASLGLAVCGPVAGWLTSRWPAGRVMAVAVLTCPVALVLLAYAGPLPLYVGALGLTGLCTGMGYNVGQLAIQNVLPPERSAEGTGVMLTVLLCVGGIGVVGASAVIEAVGPNPPTPQGIRLTLLLLAGLLLVVGLLTAAGQRGSSRPTASAQPR